MQDKFQNSSARLCINLFIGMFCPRLNAFIQNKMKSINEYTDLKLDKNWVKSFTLLDTTGLASSRMMIDFCLNILLMLFNNRIKLFSYQAKTLFIILFKSISLPLAVFNFHNELINLLLIRLLTESVDGAIS
jgi:hypothetical protein